ncbi:MAG: hypothetical protein M3P49_07870 [Actinomycetota bacterium]|nr:hypothetical protein [Actinomycetota bacterium]
MVRFVNRLVERCLGVARTAAWSTQDIMGLRPIARPIRVGAREGDGRGERVDRAGY